MKEITARLLHLLFPITCASCHSGLPYNDTLRICPDCYETIKFIEGLYCVSCSKPLPDGGAHCYSCRIKKPRFIEYNLSCAEYEGTTKSLIRYFKYSGKDYLSDFFAALLYRKAKQNKLGEKVDCIVPVPAHWAKRFVRGYNQTELLAKALCKKLEVPVLDGLLKKPVFSFSQTGLSKEKRFANVSGNFKINGNGALKGRNILLLDDVYTTGATISECARILKKSGARKVYSLTIARD
ncbi:MAG TPA: ComF family protein [Elusimicrobia bacterium]|nr:MAG: hypothetical protein A2278_01605 [Elusimicrobia bacterium RIFOXYA12_FULL_49_49]OGS06107.1 MAG: hypothetical protein A2204_01765 [Elusimicrobia bacterium RIFOXYA1_FULL_47_7]OGS11744.1 MAG: hypothetical protein A2386_01640 [Elusimicrobia bacterium RIFOXYB1_FULL_48_9]OGS16744.1 MAG: hypothetical protein A2251_05055 [Elusimicrobia bacterium RIFOXYA2_FULL_47_53]OGS27025.1 MAG: hypothetical protein A2339_04910 [Elusimicrobia bacterium RIFOXYB12_FULL_50_12]OGS31972.1 MAG: hypothetical protein